MKYIKYISLALVCLAVIASAYFGFHDFRTAKASVITGESYFATTTASGLGTPGTVVLKAGPGQLGSVIITGPSTGNFTLYDATTSNVSLRTGGTATNTLIVASIPAGMGTSTIIYDVTLNSGLLLVQSGVMPTTTITYK